MQKIKIQVTDADIRLGKPGPKSCPIALALNRAIFGTKIGPIEVEQGFLSLKGNSKLTMQSVNLPDVAATFIRDFDRGLEVKPITFSVNV